MKHWFSPARGVAALVLAACVAACSQAVFLVANAPAWFGSYHRVTLPYGSDLRQKLDIYSPDTAGLHPVVVFFYGGSWTGGDKANYRFVAAALAAHGYVCVIPDYRLYPKVKFPTFVQDGALAVAWVEAHGREHGADPNRLVLMGHSAGAHMAAMLALDDRYLAAAGVPPGSVKGLIGLSGPYALDPDTDTLRATFDEPYSAADWRPVFFASDHSPPTLLIHGLADKVVYVSHTEQMRDALLAHHVRVQTQLYPDRGHADTIGSFTAIERNKTPALPQTLSFLASITAP